MKVQISKKFFSTCLVLLLLISALPYLWGVINQGDAYRFGGFLLNPIDGNSYLAKMYEGWLGNWSFTLPYTAQLGQGAYLFLFYLFLGHFARWVGLPLIVMFHLARMGGIFLLAFASKHFCEFIFPTNPRASKAALALVLFGSGLGWIASFFQLFTSDLWVAEAYPFLSAFSSPHFTIGIAIVLWVFILTNQKPNLKNALLLFISGLLLSAIMPFDFVITAIVITVALLWSAIETRQFMWQPFVSFGIGGGLYLTYQYWIILSTPLLSGWNAQNVTPAPAFLNFVLSFSPALILAIWGLWSALRQHEEFPIKLLLVWLVLAPVLIYLPFSLQRRFMAGYYIPVAILAVYAIYVALSRTRPALNPNKIFIPVFIVSILTNVIVLFSGLYGAQAHNQLLYLSKDEDAAISWIKANTPQDAIILASPQIGTFIPALTGRHVLWGHPFETVNSDIVEKEVIQFYSGSVSEIEQNTYLQTNRVNYLFLGPRERQMGSPSIIKDLTPVYQNASVSLYQVTEP
ncbi:MAG: hypothetical protein ABSA51_09750 [Anaerolineaceae bacterium]|jgi:hypothetical protein